MHVLNERFRVKKAIERWISQYGLERTYYLDKRGRHVGAELAALDPETATSDQVSEIIGNSSWSGALSCDECGQETWDLVQLGQPPDYESSTAYICRGCLMAALRLLGDEPSQSP